MLFCDAYIVQIRCVMENEILRDMEIYFKSDLDIVPFDAQFSVCISLLILNMF